MNCGNQCQNPPSGFTCAFDRGYTGQTCYRETVMIIVSQSTAVEMDNAKIHLVDLASYMCL